MGLLALFFVAWQDGMLGHHREERRRARNVPGDVLPVIVLDVWSSTPAPAKTPAPAPAAHPSGEAGCTSRRVLPGCTECKLLVMRRSTDQGTVKLHTCVSTTVTRESTARPARREVGDPELEEARQN